MSAALELRDKKFDSALKLATAVQEDNPTSAEAYILASSALVLLKREAEAFAVLDRALKAAPDSDLPAIEIAKLRFNAGQTEAGFQAIKSWLAAHPNNVRGTAFLAESLTAHNREADAVPVYEKILKLEPENPIALNNLANILASRDPAKALDLAERAYKQAPGDASVTDTLGWLLLKNGQTKRALALIDKAFQAAPAATEIHFHFAAALAQNGEKAQARKELEKLLAIKENFPVKQEAKALLSTL